MKDYSQNGEQKLILDYFRGKEPGTFIDIGANDGMTLSNTYALVKSGWIGVCVEPSPNAFELLLKNHKGNMVSPHLCAIGTKTDRMELLESNSHIVNGSNNNIALLSTLKPSEVERWKGTQDFTPVMVQCFTWKDYLEMYGLNGHFDMINIDAEGLDLEILQQINLTNTKLLCIEWNGNENIKHKITEYCQSFRLNLSYTNGENLIFTR